MAYDDNIIENIKSQCNIVDIIGENVELKKAGSNYKGCCPFHNEKTPSFVVSETKQIFTCFGCGATGDVFEFVQKYYNLTFRESIEKLADKYNIKYVKNKKNENKKIFYELNILAAKYFRYNFWNYEEKQKKYMKEREIKDEILKKFGIGYSQNNWTGLYDFFKSRKIDENLIKQSGLFSISNGKIYDKFRNRIIFPIFDTRSRVIGFGGRIIDEGIPKYLNSPESNIFLKKNNLYGLNFAKEYIEKSNSVILVEGYMDVISLHQHGIKNVVASLGTALTENQIKLIKRYTKNIILSYDSDEAGKNATLRAIDLINNEECNAKILNIQDGKDPDEFVKKNGKKEFIKLIETSSSSVEYKINMKKENIDVKTFEGSIEFLNEVALILSELKPIEASLYIKKISREMGVSENTLKRAINDNLSTEKNKKDNKLNNNVYNSNKTENTKFTVLEKTILSLILTNEYYFDKVMEKREYIINKFINNILKIMERAIYEKDYEYARSIIKKSYETLVKKINDEICLNGNIDEICEDCFKKIVYNHLLEKKKILMTKLSMADEEANSDAIFKISQELQEIQNIIKNRS